MRRWAALVGDLVVSGDVAELRQLYRVEQAGDEQKLDALVNYAQRGKGGLSVRAIRQITSPEDVAAGRTRGLVEFEEATPFGRKRVGVELLLIVSREGGTPRLVAVRIANAPKF